MNTTEKKVSPIIITLAMLFAIAVVVQVFRVQFENGHNDAMNEVKLVKVEKDNSEAVESFVLGAPSEASLAKGLEIYKKSCASCHGADGKSGIMPTNPAPRNFTKPDEYKFGTTYGDILNTIKVGSPGTTMAGFGYLPENELIALTHYVAEFLPKDAASSSKPKVVDPSSIKLDDDKMNTILKKLAK